MPRLSFVTLALILGASTAMADGPSHGSRFVHDWDGNGNGTVLLGELMRLPDAVFERFDLDGDGLLDPSETARFDESRRGDIRAVGGRNGGDFRRMAAGFGLKRADIDGNGRISRSEFRLGAAEWLAMLDRDSNGRVTPYDFAAR